MSNAIEFHDVDILFAREGGRAGARALREALARLDAGANRTDILSSLQVTVGVAGANLNVAQGEISVMMGLSGSGKSTLLRAANGLNRVTRGRVLLRDGEAMVDVATADAATLRHLRRRRVAMVFQQFALLPWRSVRDNVGFGLELRGEPAAELRRAVDEKLELVGLTQWAERQVGELSGGMQQRVGLARAFATDADILLMDEPFSALDPLIRGKLQDELLVLQERVKKTILFVSHDLDEALRIGDTISILQHGRIVQTGAARDIVLRPADDYVSEFVRHMNPLNVLTGEMIMLDLAAGTQRYALELTQPDGTSCRLTGALRRIAHVDPAAAQTGLEGQVAAVPGSASLQEIIHLHQATGYPVLLTAQGRIFGICGEQEIIRALAGRPAAV
ncbi:MAG: ATP-binding cassette domain-containing protein [Proteobacteria bacterium]|nr:ATP-binding cassette domain-containing protein [Pseudomonadota bacterium]